MSKKDYRLGWHIQSIDGLKYGDNRKPEVGAQLKMKVDASRSTTPILCSQGMHASPTIVDALRHVKLMPNRKLTLVLVQGDVTARSSSGYANNNDPKKFVGRYRTVLGEWSYARVREIVLQEIRKNGASTSGKMSSKIDMPVGSLNGYNASVSNQIWFNVERRCLRSLGLQTEMP